MPTINITEVDLTNPGSLNVTSNVVYVPGLAKILPPDFDVNNKPRLYQDLSSFQADFGNKVPRIGLGTHVNDVPGFGNGFAYDTGYIYATELLRLGMPVLYDCLCAINQSGYAYKVPGSDSDTIEKGKLKDQVPDNAIIQYIEPRDEATDFDYAGIVGRIETALAQPYLKDKGLYNIKFISNGGYAQSDINASMKDLAADRQDCCAILDFPYKHSIDTIVHSMNNLAAVGMPTIDLTAKYCAAFTPWATYAPPCIQNYFKTNDEGKPETDPTTNKYVYYPSMYELPASFGYLMAAATCFKVGVNNWAAIAGAARGPVPFLQSVKDEITEAQIKQLQTRQSVSINPIATINPFGVIIWGNRTLHNNAAYGNLTASSFLNIRNLVSDIKKTVFTAARQMTFEQNSSILWVKFKSIITPTLDRMVSGGGLSGYELIKNVTKEKAKLVATVRLFAIEAVEDFDITIELADQTAAIIE